MQKGFVIIRKIPLLSPPAALRGRAGGKERAGFAQGVGVTGSPAGCLFLTEMDPNGANLCTAAGNINMAAGEFFIECRPLYSILHRS